MTFDEWWETSGLGAGYETAKRIWHAALESQWQPIETAPRDGTEILMSWPYGFVGSDGLYKHSFTNATHWMPLPAPPK